MSLVPERFYVIGDRDYYLEELYDAETLERISTIESRMQDKSDDKEFKRLYKEEYGGE